jgi:pyridoxamine 5'-phosphate oxidase
MDLADLRREYGNPPLRDADLRADPMEQLALWLQEALAAGIAEPNAMALATVGAGGVPACRMVLLRGIELGSAVFFTNLESRKALELAAEPRCALLWWWGPLERQVRLEGRARALPRERSAAYFATRPRASQLAAWASPQSRPLQDRADLEARLAAVAARFGSGDVPLPPTWGGYAVVPAALEFWQGRPARLHDRFRFERAGATWTRRRLAP